MPASPVQLSAFIEYVQEIHITNLLTQRLKFIREKSKASSLFNRSMVHTYTVDIVTFEVCLHL